MHTAHCWATELTESLDDMLRDWEIRDDLLGESESLAETIEEGVLKTDVGDGTLPRSTSFVGTPWISTSLDIPTVILSLCRCSRTIFWVLWASLAATFSTLCCLILLLSHGIRLKYPPQAKTPHHRTNSVAYMTKPRMSSVGWKTTCLLSNSSSYAPYFGVYNLQTETRENTSPAASIPTKINDIPRTVWWRYIS